MVRSKERWLDKKKDIQIERKIDKRKIIRKKER